MLQRAILAILFICLPAPGQQAGISASLGLPSQQDASLVPYRQAELSIQNKTPGPVESVQLQPAGGGPTIQYRLTVPGNGQAKLLAALPAYAPVQDYRVKTLDQAGRLLSESATSIVWPAEMVNDAAFVSDAYRIWLDSAGGFSGGERTTAVLLLCIYAATVVGACFIPHPLLRAVMAATIAGGGVAVTWAMLQSRPVLAQQRYSLTLLADGQPVGGESFTIVAARRLARPQLTLAGVPYRVYPNRQAMAADASIVMPAQRKIELSIRPGEAAVLKAAGEARLDEPTGASLPAGGLANRFAAQLIIKDGDVYVAEGSQGGNDGSQRAKPAWLIAQHPEQFGMDAAGAKLFLYWRQGHQRASKTYRLYFTANVANHVRLIAEEM